MPKKKYTGKRLFPFEQGRLQFLFMPDDDYVTEYCTILNRKEYVCRQLKAEGYGLIIGLEYQNGQYRIWTPEKDAVSDYVYKNPKEAVKSREQILQILEKPQKEDVKPPSKTGGFPSSFALNLGPAPSASVQQEFFKSAKLPKLEEKTDTVVNTHYSFDTSMKLITKLDQSLRWWMQAKERFAFVVNANDWNQLLDTDKNEKDKNEEGILLARYKDILKLPNSRGLFLQLISPTGSWADHYNKAIVVPRAAEIELEEISKSEVGRDSHYFRKWVRKAPCVSYVSSVTVENVEQMLKHMYLIKHPKYSIDFENLHEAAKELVYLMTTANELGVSGKASKALSVSENEMEMFAAEMKKVDKTHPIRTLRQFKFDDADEWDKLLRYMANCPPRYFSWRDIPLKKIDELNSYLKGELFGQNQQIDRFCEALKAGIKECRRRVEEQSTHTGPPVVIFLAGPSRTGKSALVRRTTEFLFPGSSNRLHDDFNGNKIESKTVILGAPPSFAGYNAPNPFKDFLRQDVCKFFLFDEIHSAKPEIQNLFMPMMEAETGKLTFSDSESVTLEETIIVLTSNNGCMKDVTEENVPEYDELVRIVTDSYNKEFDKPWRNRIGKNFICFNYTTEDAVRKMAVKELEARKRKLPGLVWENTSEKGENIIEYLTSCGMSERLNGAENVLIEIKEHINHAMDAVKPLRKERRVKLCMKDGILCAEYL